MAKHSTKTACLTLQLCRSSRTRYSIPPDSPVHVMHDLTDRFNHQVGLFERDVMVTLVGDNVRAL